MMPERQAMFSSAHRVENSMEKFEAQNFEGCLRVIGFLSKNALNRDSALQGDVGSRVEPHFSFRK